MKTVDELSLIMRLLGDAMGARLLLREQAYAVGLKARKAAVALKADVVAKKKAVQRRYAGLLWTSPFRSRWGSQRTATKKSRDTKTCFVW